jgi:hypothetical protein
VGAGGTRSQAYHDEVRRLVFWHVEDVLKTKYAEFVDTLSAATKDPLEHLKNKAMKSAQVKSSDPISPNRNHQDAPSHRHSSRLCWLPPPPRRSRRRSWECARGDPKGADGVRADRCCWRGSRSRSIRCCVCW